MLPTNLKKMGIKVKKLVLSFVGWAGFPAHADYCTAWATSCPSTCSSVELNAQTPGKTV